MPRAAGTTGSAAELYCFDQDARTLLSRSDPPMAGCKILLVALFVSATLLCKNVAAEGTAEGSGSGGSLDATAEPLAPEMFEEDASLEQGAKPTVRFNRAVAEHRYIRDRNLASCADWAIIVVDFTDDSTGTALIAGPYSFFDYNRDARPNPRACARLEGSGGAEIVHLFPDKRYSVLATHFYRAKDAGKPQYEGRYALAAVVFCAKACVLRKHINPDDMGAVASCAESYMYKTNDAPWAAFLLVSPALAGSVATSLIPPSLALTVDRANLVHAKQDIETTFYVLPR